MADSEETVARLLAEYSSKPPDIKFDAEDKKHLRQIVKQSRAYRRLKDAVRIEAWKIMVPALQMDVNEKGASIKLAHAQGRKAGILEAVDMLEQFVEAEDESDE